MARRKSTNTGAPGPDTFAVVPVGKHDRPQARGMSKADARSAARDRNARPSTRRGLGSSDHGPGSSGS
jgi:hypothetical protein